MSNQGKKTADAVLKEEEAKIHNGLESVTGGNDESTKTIPAGSGSVTSGGDNAKAGFSQTADAIGEALNTKSGSACKDEFSNGEKGPQYSS